MKKLMTLTIIVLVCYVIYQYFQKDNANSTKIENSIQPVPINTLIGDTKKYHNKKVSVRGAVSQTYNFQFLQFFQIRDNQETTIWVRTEKSSVPQLGDTVTVTGVFQQAFKINNYDLPVILEP